LPLVWKAQPFSTGTLPRLNFGEVFIVLLFESTSFFTLYSLYPAIKPSFPPRFGAPKARWRLMPNDSRVYYHIGKALSKLNRRKAAIQSLRRSLELQPTWATHYALGEELGFDGQAAEARKELEQVILLKPEYAPAHLNLGVALQQLGLGQEALAQFEETLRLEPDNRLAAQYLEALRARRGEGKP
jgi:tetratricopeptide (TPR) repeat protein